MSNTPERPTAGARSSFHAFATIVLAVGLFAGMWLATKALAAAPATGTSDVAQADSVELWPTVPPTVAPHSAASSLPMPTPIPMPRWEEQRELIVGTFTLDSTQEAAVPGLQNEITRRTAWLQILYSVEMTVDLSMLGPEAVRRDGNTIAVTIPAPVWKRPAFAGITSLEREHASALFPQGVPEQVISKGVADVVRELETNDGLRRLAYDAARNQMTSFLTDLGFRQVTVTIGE